MARPKRDLTKITINLPTPVLKLVDDYAQKHNIARSVAIMLLCTDGLYHAQVDVVKAE